jgi:putative glutamine amidotransferase
VDPARYAAARHPNAGEVDENRDRTDAAVLEHALAAAKPVLAICYGCQALNVFLGGTLIQDIPADLPGALLHGKSDLAATAQSGDLEHEVALVPGSRLAALSGSGHAIINTSHHQAIDRPGKNLRVTAQAPDGIVEAVEWQGDRAGDNPWVVGVQWHPERMPDDRFSHQLFQNFVTAVRTAHGALSPSS